MDLEQALTRLVEYATEELHIVRKRAKEKTPARDHAQDFHEMENAADRRCSAATGSAGCVQRAIPGRCPFTSSSWRRAAMTLMKWSRVICSAAAGSPAITASMMS